jgi:site-specific DNA recombinase
MLDRYDDPSSAIPNLAKRAAEGDRIVRDTNPKHLRLVIEIRAVFRGGRVWRTGAAAIGRVTKAVDPRIAKSLRAIHAHVTSIDASPLTPSDRLPSARAAADSFMRRLIPLAFLAPDLQKAALGESLPADVDLDRLLHNLPLAWEDQRRALIPAGI